MAASRQHAPLREMTGAVTVQDGTMCRMPSPLPGPLRSDPAHELLELSSALDSETANSVLQDIGSFTQASISTETNKNPAPPRSEKVA